MKIYSADFNSTVEIKLDPVISDSDHNDQAKNLTIDIFRHTVLINRSPLGCLYLGEATDYQIRSFVGQIFLIFSY